MGDPKKLHLKRAKLKIERTDRREENRKLILGGRMAIFESLANSLKILAIGDRVKVTLRPETGRFPNPMEGRITRKDDSGNFSIESEQGIIQVSAGDILSITKLSR
jgi:FKBP-type peptidyl-prolyl cis-trans isomerase 2